MEKIKMSDAMLEVSAVIFDMDGLMLDTEHLARRAWDRALADWGCSIPDEIYFQVVGRTERDSEEIMRQCFGQAMPVTEMCQRKRQYFDEELVRNGISIKPGLMELLEWLDSTPLSRAVASSTFRTGLTRKLELTGLSGHFDVTVSGDEVQHSKPAPDIFLAAAEKLCVRAERCVVLEDSEAGIRAAYAAGMIPIMVPDGKPPSAEVARLAHRVFPSLHQVKFFLSEALEITV